MTDITERLRTRNGSPAGFGLGPVCDEAANTIEALRAEVARLRAALSPFASVPVEYLAGGIYEVTVNGRDLIAARAAIDAARTALESK